jgi:hypothetical protein
MASLSNAFNDDLISQPKRKYTKAEILKLLQDLKLIDTKGRFVGWEHVSEYTGIVFEDIMKLVNGKVYPPRGNTEEFRIPEDLSTEIYNKIKRFI